MSLVSGYPFQLYYYVNGGQPEFFLSPNLDAARKEFDKSSPVKVTILIKLYGHKYTHSLLRKYGSSWVCREGSIYYRNRNKDI
jgi:hypothetical protein